VPFGVAADDGRATGPEKIRLAARSSSKVKESGESRHVARRTFPNSGHVASTDEM
jgi:hypothetical protein